MDGRSIRSITQHRRRGHRPRLGFMAFIERRLQEALACTRTQYMQPRWGCADQQAVDRLCRRSRQALAQGTWKGDERAETFNCRIVDAIIYNRDIKLVNWCEQVKTRSGAAGWLKKRLFGFRVLQSYHFRRPPSLRTSALRHGFGVGRAMVYERQHLRQNKRRQFVWHQHQQHCGQLTFVKTAPATPSMLSSFS